MTITSSTFYWLTRCDNIRQSFSAILAASTFLLIVSIILHFGNILDRNSLKRVIPLINRLMLIITPFFFISAMGSIFIPTTKEMCAIYIIPEIVNNEKVQNVCNEAFDCAIDWLKQIKDSKNGK